MGHLVIILLLLFTSAASAAQQPMDSVAQAQGGLEYMLNTLKESVARLNKENKDLAAANDQIRQKLKPYVDQLNLEKSRESKISAQFQSMDQRVEKRSAEIQQNDLQLKQLSAMRDSLISSRATLENALKLKDLQDNAVAVQIASLSREIQDIRSGFVPGQDRSAELGPLRTTQAALQKEIDVSSAELKRAMDEWKELTVVINAGPAQVDELVKEQTGLKKDIAQRTQESEALEKKLVQLSKEGQELTVVVSPDKLTEIEKNNRVLEMQAQDIENQNADSDRRDRLTKTSTSAPAKLKRSEVRFKDLLARNKDLKAELKNLQRSMVSLDKKKADLEKELDQTQ